MFRNGILWRIILAIILVALLAIVGYGVYRLGYAQGYQAARVAFTGGGRSGIRPLPFFGGLPNYGFRPGVRFPFFFSFFVPFFWIGIILLVFFAIRALIRPWSGQHSASPIGPSGTGSSPSDPANAGPYDPYHLRDQQGPTIDQPGSGAGAGPTPSQP